MKKQKNHSQLDRFTRPNPKFRPFPRLHPVIHKVHNRYFYTRRALGKPFRLLAQNVLHSLTTSSHPNPSSASLQQPHFMIPSISEQHVLSYQKIPQLEHTKMPLLISSVTKPEFQWPEFLDVLVHKGKKILYQGLKYVKFTKNQYFDKIQKLKMARRKKRRNNQNYNYSVPQMELQNNSYQVPELVKKFIQKVYKVNLWIYNGRRQTDWHYDGHDNVLYMLKGTKTIYLQPYSKLPPKSIFSLNNNHIISSSFQSSQAPLKAILNPKSALFIPRGWWHRVETNGNPSIAINYWGNSIMEMLKKLDNVDKILLMREVVHQVIQEFCQKVVEKWAEFDEIDKEEFRAEVGAKTFGAGNINKQKNQ